jgi:hypothetical protein
LEDYYTEALAWCLRSKEFRKDFFQLIRNSAPGSNSVNLPQDGGDGIEIHTQLGFTHADDEGDGSSTTNKKRRRFDLVIQSKDFVIVLEDKVKWHFTENQIPDYQKALKTEDRFKDFQTKFLVLLSPSGKSPGTDDNSIPVIPMKWAMVQQALMELSGMRHLQAGDKLNLPAVKFVCAQFADFLKEKGMYHMNIPKLIGKPSFDQSSFADNIRFCYGIQQLLAKFRENSDSEELRSILDKKPQWFEKGEEQWICLGGNAEKFWINFLLSPKLVMSVETHWINRPTDPEKLFNKEAKTANNMKYEEWPEKNGFRIYEEFSDKYDGDSGKIKEWFAEATDMALALRKGVKPDLPGVG